MVANHNTISIAKTAGDLFHPIASNSFINTLGAMNCTALELCEVFQDLKQEIISNNPNNFTLEEEEEANFADDATWVLTSSFVILTMQSGFGLLEMGSSTSGNEINIMIKNVADVIFGSLAYWLFGYGISYGKPSSPFMGLGQFAPNGSYSANASGLFFSKYVFQFSFAATSTTIVSGCVAMRMRFLVYCIFAFFSILVYAFVAHWVWADDGWLNQHGMHDFAGGGPVHLVGGMNGLVAILMLGPRTGRFDGTRPKSSFKPSSPVSMLFGLFMLWWGWIGFNCGSSFGITGQKWVVATRAAITTINATSGGGLVAILWSLAWTKRKLIRVDDIVNGILGSLVAITPSCAAVHTYDALTIGAVGGLIAITSNEYVKHLQIDDPVGALGVHLAAAIWGLVTVGLFADSSLPGIDVRDGLFRGGGFELLGIQSMGIVIIMLWSAACSSIIFYLIGVAVSKDWKDPRSGLRISLEEELMGADIFLHGVEEYVWSTGQSDDFDLTMSRHGSNLNMSKHGNTSVRRKKLERDVENDCEKWEENGVSTRTNSTKKSSTSDLRVASGSDDDDNDDDVKLEENRVSTRTKTTKKSSTNYLRFASGSADDNNDDDTENPKNEVNQNERRQIREQERAMMRRLSMQRQRVMGSGAALFS